MNRLYDFVLQAQSVPTHKLGTVANFGDYFGHLSQLG
jgi:hypothetical protein